VIPIGRWQSMSDHEKNEKYFVDFIPQIEVISQSAKEAFLINEGEGANFNDPIF